MQDWPNFAMYFVNGEHSIQSSRGGFSGKPRSLVSSSRYTPISSAIAGELRLRTSSTRPLLTIWSSPQRDSLKRWQRRKLHQSCCLHHRTVCSLGRTRMLEARLLSASLWLGEPTSAL